MPRVSVLLDGYRNGSLSPQVILRDFGADAGLSARATHRWTEGEARALEGVPVMVRDKAARAFAEQAGAVPVDADVTTAPLTIGGSVGDMLGAAGAGRASLLARNWPVICAAHVQDLVVVCHALGEADAAAPLRVGRIAGVRATDDAARRADDLAASLCKGLGLAVETLSLAGASRLRAAAADVDVLLLPGELALAEEAGAAGLAVLALAGAWDKQARLVVVLAGVRAMSLTRLGVSLSDALGG